MAAVVIDKTKMKVRATPLVTLFKTWLQVIIIKQMLSYWKLNGVKGAKYFGTPLNLVTDLAAMPV